MEVKYTEKGDAEVNQNLKDTLKEQSSFTHPYVIANLYDLLSSVEHK